jgi:hypothetical protein
MSASNLPEDKAVESSMDKLVAKQFSSRTFLDRAISLAGVATPNSRPPPSGPFRLEDVKKLICLSFHDFIFDPKCLPPPSGRLYGILERFS